MSQLAYRPSALDAAVAASQAAAPGTGYLLPRLGSEADAPATDEASVALLWRIRRRIGRDAMPLLQFVPCNAGVGAGPAAAGFARAAAALLGRSLFIDAQRAANSGAVPDAYVRRLYHQCLAGPALCSLLSQSVDSAGRPAGAFSAIVINQMSSESGDGAYAAAPLCRGTVLVVRAGLTQLRQVRHAAQRIEAVGGVILGTVLIDAQAPARAH